MISLPWVAGPFLSGPAQETQKPQRQMALAISSQHSQSLLKGLSVPPGKDAPHPCSPAERLLVPAALAASLAEVRAASPAEVQGCSAAGKRPARARAVVPGSGCVSCSLAARGSELPSSPAGGRASLTDELSEAQLPLHNWACRTGTSCQSLAGVSDCAPIKRSKLSATTELLNPTPTSQAAVIHSMLRGRKQAELVRRRLRPESPRSIASAPAPWPQRGRQLTREHTNGVQELQWGQGWKGSPRLGHYCG